MPGRGKALSTVVKLGVKYGPVAYEAVRHGREPAKELAQKALAKAGARRQALAHAESILGGSVLRVFSGDQQVWVVFSGDEPVSSHPAVPVPLEELLAHADLTRRIRPADVRGRRLPGR